VSSPPLTPPLPHPHTTTTATDTHTTATHLNARTCSDTSLVDASNLYYCHCCPCSLSSHPTYTVAGNHEVDVNSDFANYRARFSVRAFVVSDTVCFPRFHARCSSAHVMLVLLQALKLLGAASGSSSNRWYSWEDGPVHWTMLDTEVFSHGTQRQVQWVGLCGYGRMDLR
jgi:hypothetical protein